MKATENLITHLILYIALVGFAYFGITQIAPAVGQMLSERMERAVNVSTR